MSSHKFDREYFEDGIRTNKSLYENYRWMPNVSLPMANTVKMLYPNKVILDYGCAKGFMVYALQLLGVEAYGYDISEYAVKNCKDEVRKHIFSRKEDIPDIDIVFIKDVLEHLEYDDIDNELKWMYSICDGTFCIIPFGEDRKYRIPEYGFDKTHIIKENEEWWIKKFLKAGFIVDEFYHKYNTVKENWLEHHSHGNGVFICSKN